MATFTVENLADAGKDSLRDLIARANASPGPDVIKFDSSLNNGTISLASGTLEVTDELTIDASSLTAREGVTIQGNKTFGLFSVISVTNADFTIDNLTLTGGRTRGGGDGGAIESDGNVFVHNSTISGNSGHIGGGISSFGTTEVADSTVSGNSAREGGGGIFSSGTIHVARSAIFGNSAGRHGVGGIFSNSNTYITDSTVSGNSGGEGGGIFSRNDISVINSTISGNSNGGISSRNNTSVINSTISSNSNGGISSRNDISVINSTISGNSNGGIFSQNDISVINSTISGNSSGRAGGGIFSQNDISVINSTISGNSARYDGGGIRSNNNTSVINSTVSGNSSGRDGGGIASGYSISVTNSTISGNSSGRAGGGIFSYDFGLKNLNNSIIAGNIANINPNIEGTIGENNNNIIANSTNGIIETTLKDNGGTTQTLALVPGSPAIDAGNNSLAVDLNGNPLTGDQRGLERFVGPVDIGAFELQQASTPGTIQFNSANYTVNENGTAATAITLVRTGGSDGAVNITVTPTNGTATAPGDYNNTPIVVRFANGQTSKTVTIPIVDDSNVEANETINLALSNPTNGATVGTQNTATLTIIDNDESGTNPGIIIGTAANDTLIGTNDAETIKGKEGNDVLRGEGGNDTLDGGPGSDRVSGQGGADTFVVLSGEGKDTINDFAPGEDLLSSDLDFAELNTFVNNGNLNIANSNTNNIFAVLRNTTEFTQADYVKQGEQPTDPGVIEFNLASYSVNEDGTAATAITLVRTGGSDGAVNITVTPTNGTATAPGDYNNTPIVVSFADGQTSKTLIIPIVDDSDVEADETINLALSNLTNGATVGSQDTATLTIIDNDQSGTNPPIIEGTPNNDTLTGTSDAEIIRGKEGNDLLRAEGGNDTLDGGPGSDRLNGQAGADTFVVLSGEGKDTINDFVPGEDLFSSNLDFAQINTFVNNGNLNIVNSNNNEILAVLRNTTEFTQSDYILFNDLPIIQGTANNDTITGTNDAEIIRGKEGNDLIRAEAGDDILEGGPGSDRLTGQGGADTFVVLSGEGKDIINDFVRGEDLLSSNLDFADINTFVNNGNLNIVDSNTNNIFAVLRNTTEFTQSDYLVAGSII